MPRFLRKIFHVFLKFENVEKSPMGRFRRPPPGPLRLRNSPGLLGLKTKMVYVEFFLNPKSTGGGLFRPASSFIIDLLKKPRRDHTMKPLPKLTIFIVFLCDLIFFIQNFVL